jgi:hypothetical protein
MAGRKKFTNNGVVSYRRPKVLVRTKPNGEPIEVDMALADQILQESLEVAGLAHMPPKGSCYDCDKRIPPMRKLCGSCMSKREQRKR